MGVLRKHKAPLSRQMHKATEIDCSKAKIILKSKSEYNGARVPWVTVEVGGKARIQEYRGSEAEPARSGLPRLQVQGPSVQPEVEEEMEARSNQVSNWEKEIKRLARSQRQDQVPKRVSREDKDPQPKAKRIRENKVDDDMDFKDSQEGHALGQDLGEDVRPRPKRPLEPPLKLGLNNPLTTEEVQGKDKDIKAVAGLESQQRQPQKAYNFGASDIRYRTVIQALMDPVGPRSSKGRTHKERTRSLWSSQDRTPIDTRVQGCPEDPKETTQGC